MDTDSTGNGDGGRNDFAGLQARLDAAGLSLDGMECDANVLRGHLNDCMTELNGLRIAMANRSIIEQAKGMLMLTLNIDESAAFAYLRDISNRTNRKVAEIATDVVRTRAGAVTH